MMHPARERQIETERLYRLKQRRERQKEALSAVACCLIVIGLTLLFLWSI